MSCKKDDSIDLRNEIIGEYLDCNDSRKRMELEQYIGMDCSQQYIPIEWDDDNSLSYAVIIADNEKFEFPYISFTRNNKASGGICVPGKTYFYRIYGLDTPYYMLEEDGAYNFNGQTLVKSGTFKTKNDTVRFVNIPNIHKNCRDLGGWKTEDGKQVRYEKLYRGGNLVGFSDFSKTVMTYNLGIKTEIDLRQEDDRPEKNSNNLHSSIIDENINYVEAPIVTCSYILPQWSQDEPHKRSYYTPTKNSLYNAFKCLANEENYPVYFHCNGGADRTGTFAFLVSGLLGVKLDDLFLDFELTAFAGGGSYNHFRGPRSENGRVIGTAQDDTQNYVAIGTLYQNIMKWYGTEDGKLSSAISNYLTSFIGIEQKDIDSIKGIMLK